MAKRQQQGRNGHGSATGTPAAPLKRGRKHRNIRKQNGLTTYQGAAGRPAHIDAIKRAKELALISERQFMAWNLFVAGATFEQVGKELKVSNKTAWTDVMAVKDSLPLVLAHHGVEVLKARVLARTDALVRTHWPAKAKKDSADVILKAMEREAKVVGYDAKREDGFTAEQVTSVFRAMLTDLLELITDPATRQAIAEVMRRRAGLLAGETIDVPPEKK